MKNFLLITLLFSLCSCAPYNKNPVTTLAPNEDGGVNVVSGNLSKVKNVNITRSFNQEVNGKLLAKVEVENTSSSPTVFMYKFDWIQKDGSIDSASSTWQTATISGKEVKTLQDVNVRGGATDFRILLKKSK
jgi:uncharacterized protein YcfL